MEAQTSATTRRIRILITESVDDWLLPLQATNIYSPSARHRPEENRHGSTNFSLSKTEFWFYAFILKQYIAQQNVTALFFNFY